MIQISELSKGLIFDAPLSEWGLVAGANLVTNGTFDIDNGWVKGAGWTIGSGVASHTGGSSLLYQNMSQINGKNYTISITIVSVSGTLSVGPNLGANIIDITTAGTYNKNYTYTGNDGIIFISSDNTSSVDNITVREQNYGTLDLVSKAVGVNTATYPVLSRRGDGRREFLFDGTNDYVTLPALSAFGTGDFSVIINLTVANLSNTQAIIGGVANCFGIYLGTTGVLYVALVQTSTQKTSTTLLLANTRYTITYVRSGTTGSLYINGVLDAGGTNTDATNYSSATTNLSYWVASAPLYFSGSISMLRVFNYALSAQQITNYSKPEYPIEYTDRDGAGNLCVLDLNAEGATSSYWYDKTNSLTGTVSGATLSIPPASNLGATAFNGTTSNIVFTGMNGLTGDITISCWLYSSSLILNGGEDPIIFNNTKIYFLITAGGKKIMIFRDGSTGLVSISSLLINTWYHLTITSTSTGVSRIYINAILDNSGSSGNPVSATSYEIGTSGSMGYFNGIIDNLKIYNRVLSVDEIKLLYDSSQ